MTKGRKRLIAALSAVMICALFVGILSVNAADYETEAFFSATGGTLTVTENYNAGATSGAKLELSQTEDSATIYYNDAIPVEQLDRAITFQVLPSTDGETDFTTIQLILRDYEDPQQRISVVIDKSTIWDTGGVGHTAGFVSLEENFIRSGEGRFRLAPDNVQGIVGRDNIADNKYEDKGTMNLGTWGTHYPLLAAENKTQTAAIEITYTDFTIKVNGITVADLKNPEFQSASTNMLNETEHAEIIAKYTDEYVDSLFSSGKVKVELRFSDIGENGLAVNIANIGNAQFMQPYENNFTSTAGADSETVVGTRFNLSSTAIVLPSVDATALATDAVTFQLLPNDTGWACEYVTVTLRNSNDASKAISLFVKRDRIWWGEDAITAFVSLEENVFSVGDGFTYLQATQGREKEQSVVSRAYYTGIGAGPDTDEYSEYGTFKLGGTSHGSLLGKNEGSNTDLIKIRYENSTIYFNDVVVADLKNDFYQSLSTNNLIAATADMQNDQAIIDKYTDEYVDSLFADAQVQIELSFSQALNGSVNVISYGGQSAANLQIDYSAPQDTIAPEITAIAGDTYDTENKTFTVHPDTAYTVSELAQITASDLLDPAPVTGIEAYSAGGTKYETEQVTFAEGDYVILFAEDADGNRTEVRAEISFLPEYTITYTDGSGTDATVVQGDEYTFAAPAAREGEVFAGWQIGGKLYPADYKITVTENIEVSALFISFATDDAEAAGENAIRYFTRIDSEDYTALESAAKELQFGTVITCDSKAGHLDIETKVWVSEGAAEGCEEYRAVFTDIPEEMFGANFTATGYVIVTYENGATAIVMAEGTTASVNGFAAEA